MLWGFLLYLFAGTVVMIAYRWDVPDVVDGKDLLLDVVLWPWVLFYWARNRQ